MKNLKYVLVIVTLLIVLLPINSSIAGYYYDNEQFYNDSYFKKETTENNDEFTKEQLLNEKMLSVSKSQVDKVFNSYKNIVKKQNEDSIHNAVKLGVVTLKEAETNKNLLSYYYIQLDPRVKIVKNTLEYRDGSNAFDKNKNAIIQLAGVLFLDISALTTEEKKNIKEYAEIYDYVTLKGTELSIFADALTIE